MRLRLRWQWIPFALLLVFTATFAFFEFTGIITLEATEQWIRQAGPLAAILIVGLLVSDLVTPVPSSVLMTLSGALYGTWMGALYSTLGSVGASLLGFFLLRWFGRKRAHRFLTKKDIRSMDQWFFRWGEGILILSRMLPMLTETMSCFAGLTDISFRRFLVLILVGTIPMTVYYAYFGSVSESVSQWALPLILGIVVPGILWILLHIRMRRTTY